MGLFSAFSLCMFVLFRKKTKVSINAPKNDPHHAIVMNTQAGQATSTYSEI